MQQAIADRGAAWGPVLLAVLAALVGCANQPPTLQPVGQQTFVVGVRDSIEFRAYDPDADPLRWYCDIVGLSDEQDRSDLAQFVDKAIFTYTPLAKDVGEHQLDVTVSDGTAQDLLSVPIMVRPGAPRESQPKFIRPLGPGDTFPLDQDPCIVIDVLVEDTDSLEVDIRQEPPIPGSELNKGALGPKTTRFLHWCPDEQQRLTTRHILHLVADDGDTPAVHINDGQGYFILLDGV